MMVPRTTGDGTMEVQATMQEMTPEVIAATVEILATVLGVPSEWVQEGCDAELTDLRECYARHRQAVDTLILIGALPTTFYNANPQYRVVH